MKPIKTETHLLWVDETESIPYENLTLRNWYYDKKENDIALFQNAQPKYHYSHYYKIIVASPKLGDLPEFETLPPDTEFYCSACGITQDEPFGECNKNHMHCECKLKTLPPNTEEKVKQTYFIKVDLDKEQPDKEVFCINFHKQLLTGYVSKNTTNGGWKCSNDDTTMNHCLYWLKEVESPNTEDDVEKLALSKYPKDILETSKGCFDDMNEADRNIWIEGYKQAKSETMFSLEDMKDSIKHILRSLNTHNEIDKPVNFVWSDCFKEYIQSLTKPKEYEFIPEEELVIRDIQDCIGMDGEPNGVEFQYYQPKIVNNKIQGTWKLKS